MQNVPLKQKRCESKMSSFLLRIIGASLSEPHTNGTAFARRVCICLLVAIYRKFKLNERIRTFQICACAKALRNPCSVYCAS